MLLLRGINIFIFAAINANPTPLLTLGYFAYFWSKFSCFLLVRATGSWFPSVGGMCKFYVSIFDHWAILRYSGLVGLQQQRNQLLSLGFYTPHWNSYVCKTRQFATLPPLPNGENTRLTVFITIIISCDSSEEEDSSLKIKSAIFAVCPFLSPFIFL
jgi:hypothetical protein